MKKLTIGSAVYDDFDGVYFTYQALRLNNADIADQLDFVVIDNNPNSSQGETTKHFCETSKSIRYFPFTEKTSTSIRNEIFKKAEGEFCMSIDPHVLFEPHTIKTLLGFLSQHSESKDLFHGPMIYDALDESNIVTHMDPVWRDNMFGTWAHRNAADIGTEPFEIPMHGLGVFLAKTKEWLGFNEKFEGFGGEEGYIHEKYRQQGRKIWCLPFLVWLHRFDRPAGIPYPNIIESRIRNYIIGRQELNLPFDDVVDHFSTTYPNIDIERIVGQISNPEMHAWTESKINFKTPSYHRYIKYEVLGSYDGHGAIQHCEVLPTPPTAPTVREFSSTSDPHNIRNFADFNVSWQSSLENKNQFPHTLVLDFTRPVKMSQIITSSRPGLQAGMPARFKVYVSNDLKQWHQVSDVNVLAPS